MSHCDILARNLCQNVNFKVDVQSDHLETKCSWAKVSQGKNVTVDVSSGSKYYSGRNVGGRNIKASLNLVGKYHEVKKTKTTFKRHRRNNVQVPKVPYLKKVYLKRSKANALKR
jgi:hypothetical protein